MGENRISLTILVKTTNPVEYKQIKLLRHGLLRAIMCVCLEESMLFGLICAVAVNLFRYVYVCSAKSSILNISWPSGPTFYTISIFIHIIKQLSYHMTIKTNV